MEIIVGIIGFLLFCSIYIRIGNIVVELREMNKKIDTLAKGIEQYVNGPKPKEGR